MQTVSAELTAACSAYGQQPCVYVEFSWDRSGTILDARGAAGWTDETANLKGDSAQLSINPPGERLVPAGSVGSARITLWNQADRYSWQNEASALYADIGEANSPTGPAGVPVRIWRGYVTSNGPEYVCVFTGVVARWTPNPDFTVVFSCRDWGWVYLQNRLSLAVSQNQLTSEWIETVATASGIAAGEMDLDVGMLPIDFVWMDEEGAVEEIWRTAEADGGLAFFDQLGKLRYWNPLHWVGAALAWEFDEDGYTLAEPEINVDQVATEITVEWSPRKLGVATDLYTLDRARVVMPGQTETWEARFSQAAASVEALSVEDPYNDYWAASTGGLPMNDQVAIAVSAITGQKCTVSVTNNSPALAAVVRFLRIRGMPVVGGPNEEITVTASPAPLAFPWQRSLRSNTSAGSGPWTSTVQGNIYLQTEAQAYALANMLAVRCRRVRPIWTLRQVWGIPQLELGDTVRFIDTRSRGTRTPKEGVVIGIAWDEQPGFLQRIAVMETDDLSEYDDYFIIGATALGAEGRAWY